jgi:hypothetical protein
MAGVHYRVPGEVAQIVMEHVEPPGFAVPITPVRIRNLVALRISENDPLHRHCLTRYFRMKALNVPNWQNHPNLDIEIKVPEVRHTTSNAVLTAWLSRRPKTPQEQALKERLQALIRS